MRLSLLGSFCDVYRGNANNAAHFCPAGFEQTHRVPRNIGIFYNMYGNQYTFSFELPMD